MSRVFTVKDGLEIQDGQLKEWKCVLKEEAYQMLESLVKKHNDIAKSGYDICRGTNIYEIIANKVVTKFKQ